MELDRNGDVVFITPEYDAKGNLYDFHHDISKTKNNQKKINELYFNYWTYLCNLLMGIAYKDRI